MGILSETPETFNVIPIPRNTKIPNFKWEKYQTEKYPKKTILENNGNVAVICGDISNNLLVLDVDLKQKEYWEIIYNEFKDKLPDLAKTKIVSTPHGYHFYYYMKNFSEKRQQNKNAGYKKNFSFNGTTKTIFSQFLKGFDILGNNGYAIIPPSRVDNLYYECYNNEPIKHITEEQYQQIKGLFLLEKPIRMRKPFIDILNGKLDIEDYASTTGKKEFIYWKYLFREAFHYCGLLPSELYEGLKENQNSFDIEETEKQLEYHDYKEKPLTNDKLKEYFPDYDIPKTKEKQVENPEESDRLTVKEESDNIARSILEEFDILTLNDSRQTMIRKGIFYSFDIDVITEVLTDKIGKLTHGNYNSIKNSILEMIKDSTLFNRKDFSYDGKLMVFNNGILDFETETFYLQEENQTLKFFYEIPFDYDPKVKHRCPEYKKALRQWLGNPFSNFKTRDMFEIIGYCLTMNVSLKKAFISYGDTNSGKTQNTNIISELFNDKNKSHLTLQRVCKNEFGTHGLQFKVLNICDDLPEKTLLHVGTFKDLTGGGLSIGGEIKGGNKYSFRSVAKFIFNANQIPAIESKNDMAFFERFILIPFPNQFSLDEDNLIPDFYKLITTNEIEMRGIIHEAIKGYKRLLERKGFRSVILKDTKHIWNYESDPLYRFLYNCCKKDKFERILVDDFVERYNEESDIALTKGKITIELQKHGVYKKQNQINPDDPENQKKLYYYYGITWKLEPAIFEDVEIEERLFQK